MPNISKPRTNTILFPIIALVAIAAIINFATFKPKSLAEVREVRGASSSKKLKVPYPNNAVEISSTNTSNTQQITLQTLQTPEEVQHFYKNIFVAREWQIETEGKAGIFYVSKFKKADEEITISTSQQNPTQEAETPVTIVSIEIKQ